jgi:hypothetical protein
MNVGRRVVLAAGASFICAPLMAVAQPQGKVWRLGFLALNSRPPSLDADPFGAFVRVMRELGYLEGKNLAMDCDLPPAAPSAWPQWPRSWRR